MPVSLFPAFMLLWISIAGLSAAIVFTQRAIRGLQQAIRNQGQSITYLRGALQILGYETLPIEVRTELALRWAQQSTEKPHEPTPPQQ